MIVGIGNDILNIKRINLKIERRILTDLEKDNGKLSAQYLAGRFSLKESFFKAIGTGLGENSFKDVSFVNNKFGKPYAVFHKDFKGFNFCHVSLSHDDYVFSTVLLERVKGKIFLGLGSNLGQREENLKNALEEIQKNNIEIISISSLYITKPYGYKEQDDFYNIVIEIDTDLSPTNLLNTLLYIEKKMGRRREIKWGPRNIDIDILFYGNLVVDLPNLKIPHYDFENRDFFIAPMYEISKDFVHPISSKKMFEYFSNLSINWRKLEWNLKNI
ncbi:2-amino-4-hydroxy-6-hydroxymethyldihydropteridine diphosphokinase [Thermosipho atlanticus]|uniref:Holo-[acyl-carrier-protein] synthase n=1 Tax=Thermosipho atlanticus DSM 15807 TaxID=1123380 RepID=A0A1M5SKM5_9BACT|nr:2-amino-4-hydroxy-6-hydroxymethyldihydropteridine diphosphokinase [Thermosipho atlanticus]SHH39157.1 2-amino-4-hydroxy-6-hydroxymethyldihydropteridinediphosphokinase [Thermosipho atlanticus DSM 15807]